MREHINNTNNDVHELWDNTGEQTMNTPPYIQREKNELTTQRRELRRQIWRHKQKAKKCKNYLAMLPILMEDLENKLSNIPDFRKNQNHKGVAGELKTETTKITSKNKNFCKKRVPPCHAFTKLTVTQKKRLFDGENELTWKTNKEQARLACQHGQQLKQRNRN